jgi:[ribosomal protein S18]-alanine N-acetyltransferase
MPWSAADIMAFAAQAPVRLGCVAEAADQPVVCGYVGVGTVGEEAEILICGVDPGHRRRGVGRSLLLALRAALRLQGCRKLFLEVRRGNVAAISLYRVLGFVETGSRSKYYRDTGEDALLMAWELGQSAS